MLRAVLGAAKALGSRSDRRYPPAARRWSPSQNFRFVHRIARPSAAQRNPGRLLVSAVVGGENHSLVEQYVMHGACCAIDSPFAALRALAVAEVQPATMSPDLVLLRCSRETGACDSALNGFGRCPRVRGRKTLLGDAPSGNGGTHGLKTSEIHPSAVAAGCGPSVRVCIQPLGARL
jgi:hypothetical protein